MKNETSTFVSGMNVKTNQSIYDGLISFSAHNTERVLCFSSLSRIERELCTRIFVVLLLLCLGFCAYAMVSSNLLLQGITLLVFPLVLWILIRVRKIMQDKGFKQYAKNKGQDLSYSNDAIVEIRKYNMRALFKGYKLNQKHFDAAYRTLSRHKELTASSAVVWVAVVTAVVGSGLFILIDIWKWLFLSAENATETVAMKTIAFVSVSVLFFEIIVAIHIFQKNNTADKDEKDLLNCFGNNRTIDLGY